MWEYIGTLFACIVTFLLGYVLGRIIRKKRWQEFLDVNYEQGRLDAQEEGYSFEFQVDYGFGNYISDTSTSTKKCTVQFPLPANIVNGDKVIIQIRKKEEQK